MMKMKKNYRIILIIFVCMVAYCNTLNNGWTSEDYVLILNNDFIPHWENVRILFSVDTFLTPLPIKNAVRPLTLLSLMVDFKFWQYNPFGYHLTNILLHMVICVLIYLLFNLLGAGINSVKKSFRKNISLIAALIFALHPVQGEVVNVPGFRGDLLATVFFISAIILFIKMIEKKQIFYLPALVFSYLLAILSKEVTIVLPLVLILYLFLYEPRRIFKNKKNIMLVFILSFSSIILGGMYFLYFWKDRYTYDIFRVVFVNIIGDIMPYTSPIAYLNTIFITFEHYIETLFLPFSLSYDYQIYIPEIFSASSILGFLFLTVTVLILIKSKDKMLRFSLGIFLITYLPVSNILPLFNTVADRYLYLPMVGFSSVLATMFVIFSQRRQEFHRLHRLVTVLKAKYIIGVVLVTYFCISFNRNFIFKDIFTLYEGTVKKSPDNVRVRYNLAVANKEKRDWNNSIEELEKVMILNPLYKRDNVWQMLGECYQMLEKNSEAKRYYWKVILTNPKRETLNNMAKILWEEGNEKRSRLLWKRVVEVWPQDKMALAGLELIKDKRLIKRGKV